MVKKEILEHNRSILEWFGGDTTKFKINLLRVAAQLPNDIIFNKNAFDSDRSKKKAEELGYNYEELKHKVKKGYKGTLGIPGQPGFNIIMDALLTHMRSEGSSSTLVNGETRPHQQIITRVFNWKNARKDYLSEAEKEVVKNKGIDPEKVILIYDKLQPIALQGLAQILNFKAHRITCRSNSKSKYFS